MPTRRFRALVGLVTWAAVAVAQGADRGDGWFGPIPHRPGDERFRRIYVEDATLYHEGGREVALWGVNFQSTMPWEWSRHRRKPRFRRFDRAMWKEIVGRGFDEIRQLRDPARVATPP